MRKIRIIELIQEPQGIIKGIIKRKIKGIIKGIIKRISKGIVKGIMPF